MDPRYSQGAAPDAYNAYLYGNYNRVPVDFGFARTFSECPLFVLSATSLFFFDNLCVVCKKRIFRLDRPAGCFFQRASSVSMRVAHSKLALASSSGLVSLQSRAHQFFCQHAMTEKKYLLAFHLTRAPTGCWFANESSDCFAKPM